MPKSYSEDLQTKVITYVKKENGRYSSAAVKFEIAANTVGIGIKDISQRGII